MDQSYWLQIFVLHGASITAPRSLEGVSAPNIALMEFQYAESFCDPDSNTAPASYFAWSCSTYDACSNGAYRSNARQQIQMSIMKRLIRIGRLRKMKPIRLP